MKRLLLSFTLLSSIVCAMDRPSHEAYIMVLDELTVDDAKSSLMYRIANRDIEGALLLISMLKRNHADIFEVVIQDKEVLQTAYARIEKPRRSWSEIGSSLAKNTFYGFCATTGIVSIINLFHQDTLCNDYKHLAEPNKTAELFCTQKPTDVILPLSQALLSSIGLITTTVNLLFSSPLERTEYVQDMTLHLTLAKQKAELERDHAQASCINFSEVIKKKIASIDAKKDLLEKQSHTLSQEQHELLNQLEQEQIRLHTELEKLNAFSHQLAPTE